MIYQGPVPFPFGVDLADELRFGIVTVNIGAFNYLMFVK
jgi:hypothetical protein